MNSFITISRIDGDLRRESKLAALFGNFPEQSLILYQPIDDRLGEQSVRLVFLIVGFE